MKILIISDTHGFLWYLNEVLKKVGPIDMLIHCGDIQKDEEPVKTAVNCPVYMVAGNNDLGTLLEKKFFWILENIILWLHMATGIPLDMVWICWQRQQRKRGQIL